MTEIDTDRGRASETTGRSGVRDNWRMAREMDPGTRGGEYVPWGTVVIRYEILPRERLTPDPETVERYAATFWELPPITVQRDTFVLIDGLHRLFASEAAGSMAVLVTEVDVPDAELEDRAFELNTAHGLGYTSSERVRAMVRTLKAHLHEEKEWPDTRIAKWAGVSRPTVEKYRRQLNGVEKAQATRADKQGADQPAKVENSLGTEIVESVKYVKTLHTESQVTTQDTGTDEQESSSVPAIIWTAPEQKPAPRNDQPTSKSSGQPSPKPTANGHANGVHRPAPAPSQWRSAADVFSEFLERSPRAMADDVPEENLAEGIAISERQIRWWTENHAALRERMAVAR